MKMITLIKTILVNKGVRNPQVSLKVKKEENAHF